MTGQPPESDLEQVSSGTEMTVSPQRAVGRAYWFEIVFGSSLAVYAVMAVLAHRNAYFDWDLKLARGIQSIDLPGFHTLMVWVSALGNGWVPVALVAAAGLALLAARFRIEGLICLLGVGLGSAVNRLLKSLSDRPRPSDTLVQVAAVYRHESFPSGHVFFFVEFFGLLFFFSYVLLRRGRLRRTALAVSSAVVLLVGISRVYLGAHWPSDVLGAYLAGGLWLMFLTEIYRRLKARQKRQE